MANLDEAYFKKKALDFLASCVSRDSYIRMKMQRNYDLLNDNSDNSYSALFDAFSTTVKTDSGTEKLDLPVIYTSFNKVRNKIKSYIGDLIDMGFEAHVEAINQEARSKKMETKMRVLTAMKLQDDFARLEALAGINYAIGDEEMPETVEQLQKVMKMNYKDGWERAMEACLRYTLEYNQYILTRVRLFMDVIMGGECHAQTRVYNGFPYIERCNPITMYYPKLLNDDDYLKKCQFKIQAYYTTYADITSRMSFTPEEKEKIKKNSAAGQYQGYLIPTTGYYVFPPWDGDNILVVNCEFIDDDVIASVEKRENGKPVSFETVRGEAAKKKMIFDKEEGVSHKVERKKFNTLRKCTIIAGEVVKDYGNVEFQPRVNGIYSSADFTIASYRPFYFNGNSSSEVEMIAKIHDYRNWILQRMQLEILKSGGSGIAVDTKLLPEEWGSSQEKIKTLLYYLKAFGIVVYNSAQNEIPENKLPVERFDMGLGQAIIGYIQILGFLDKEMEDVSGVNDARMGNIVGANQLASVTAMALSQSNKVSKYLYNGFFQFESNFLNKHLQQLQMCVATYPEKYRDIIGDMYLDIVKASYEIEQGLFACTVKTDVMSRDDLNKYIISSLEHGTPPQDMLKLEMLSKDSIKEGINQYIEYADEKAKRADQMQMQQMQMQQQQIQQVEDAKTAREFGAIQTQGQVDMQKMDVKGKQDLTKIAVKDDQKLQSQLALEVAKKKLDAFPLYGG